MLGRTGSIAAARTWLETGDLQKIVIEFYRPGAASASARWDFPIRYDGNGVDEMWVDRDFLDRLDREGGARRRAGCTYRIVLRPSAGAPDRARHGDAHFWSLERPGRPRGRHR